MKKSKISQATKLKLLAASNSFSGEKDQESIFEAIKNGRLDQVTDW